MTRFQIGAMWMMVFGICLSNTPSAAPEILQAPAATQPQGQTDSTRTLLPDGRKLITGGRIDGRIVAEFLIEDRGGAVTRLPRGLLWPRASHTATVLPDGRILIFGGVSRSGRLETRSEVIDPDRFTVTAIDVPVSPRSSHTATLLTDGRVLISGGRNGAAEVLDTAEVWDPATGDRTPLPLVTAKADHEALMQPDGTILLTGGEGESQLYVPGAEVFVFAGAPPSAGPTAFVGSIPEEGAREVDPTSRIALRFSGPLDPRSINEHSIKISTRGSGVSTRLTVTENGRLLFVSPTDALIAGESYTLVAQGLQAFGGTPLSVLSLSFTIKGNQRQTVTPDDEVWRPGGPGNWRTNQGRSPWQNLPPLAAPDGVTAIAGQVLRLNGTPLEGVTLEIKGRSARCDKSGRFLLSLDTLPAGRHVLKIDGAQAGSAGRKYGFFEAGIQVLAGQTTPLPFTIWMPALDLAHAVTIPSPTTQETAITTPHIPGLELRLPPRTVIRDQDGNRVTQVSITPIPVDRPPFPLPAGVQVPIYFTVQPGGAYVHTYGTSGGARLHYPNYMAQPVGARLDFWHYEPEDRGWYVYGQGQVESSGRQVIPDPGVAIYEFTGAMISTSGTPPATWPTPGEPKGGDPVDLSSGLFVLQKTDLFLRDVLSITFARTYRPGDATSRSFGIGATHTFDFRLWRPTLSDYDDVALILPDGGRIDYERIDGGTGFVDMVLEQSSSPTAFYKSRITWNGSGFDLTLKDGTVFVFGDNAPLQAIRDRFGNTITLVRPTGQAGPITRIVSPHGRWIALTYDVSGRISQATDSLGRAVSYTYDTGRLWKVTDAGGGITEYTYDSSHRMLTVKDPRGITYLTNSYDSNGRVASQTLADGGVFQFAYTLDGSGRITQTELTNPRGFVRRMAFNAQGYHVSDTQAYGTTLERTATLTRQSGTQLVTQVMDPLNRATQYTYDNNGNVLSVVRLAGTTGAVTTTLTYEPAYQQIASITDPLNHTTTFTYDYEGRLTTITDALTHQVTLTYNAAGQPLTLTNALNQTSTLAYSAGLLASFTSPLGRTSTFVHDAAGRTVLARDAAERATVLEYSALDLVTNVLDEHGGVTALTYDGNGNLLTVTDARGKITTWTYTNMDRVWTRTEPLTRQDTITYDLNGNVKTWTDGKGQVTSYSYDGLDRQTFVGFGTTGTPPTHTSTVSTTFDLGDRATSIVDSASGTISRTFDPLDRLTQEVTPEGTINYTYDGANRRATMQVAGQTAVSYSYDNANRLTGINQGTATVTVAYDAASKRTSLTLPNGIVTEYTYDNDARLSGLTYKLGGTTIGDLVYSYDSAEHRTSVAGSYSRTALPPALGAATYDDANQIANWGGTTHTYDANANLSSDGTKTYTWNDRNELTAVSGINVTFTYDAVGRRRSRTAGSTTTYFLYDGVTPVQELVSGTPTANLLTGLKVDEFLSRTDGNGTRHFLHDALGSTIALADAAGAIDTSYTYEPFGMLTATGATSGNTFTFTGREADATGLFSYRARYYHARLQRFVSADPIGLNDGPNAHIYVRNDPINNADPLGLNVILAGRVPFIPRALPPNMRFNPARPQPKPSPPVYPRPVPVDPRIPPSGPQPNPLMDFFQDVLGNITPAAPVSTRKPSGCVMDGYDVLCWT